jgi:hypothetical protein
LKFFAIRTHRRFFPRKFPCYIENVYYGFGNLFLGVILRFYFVTIGSKITHSKSTSKGISTRYLLEEITFIEIKGISIKDLLEEAKSIGNLLGKTSFVVGALSPNKT